SWPNQKLQQTAAAILVSRNFKALSAAAAAELVLSATGGGFLPGGARRLLDLYAMRPYERKPEPRPVEATVSFLTGAELGDADLGGIQLARKAASEAQRTEAVRALLRNRLRVAFLIVGATLGAMVCLGIVNALLNPDTIPPRL